MKHARIEKSVGNLTVEDLMRHPVWEFLPETDERDETWVKPVRRLPVDDLRGRIVGSPIRLACGRATMALLGNLKLRNARATEQFLTVSLFREDGVLFHLARYHDVDYGRQGPAGLASFLGLGIKEIFPITYDLSAVASGLPEVVKGTIDTEPSERLSKSDWIALAVESSP